MRLADLFVKTASPFQAEVYVWRDQSQANGKSILELMTLLVECGTTITIEADGNDAQAAVERLVRLVENNFEEDSHDPASS